MARQRIDTGIYLDQYGVAICVKRFGVQREKRFPKDTPIEVLQRARQELQAQIGVPPKPTDDALKRHRFLFGRKECFVYFLQDGDAIKIGRAGNVQNRVSAIQGSNPRPLTLLTSTKTYDYIERALHKKFGHLRIDGEWFQLAEELQAIIRRVNDGEDLESLIGP